MEPHNTATSITLKGIDTSHDSSTSIPCKEVSHDSNYQPMRCHSVSSDSKVQSFRSLAKFIKTRQSSDNAEYHSRNSVSLVCHLNAAGNKDQLAYTTDYKRHNQRRIVTLDDSVTEGEITALDNKLPVREGLSFSALSKVKAFPRLNSYNSIHGQLDLDGYLVQSSGENSGHQKHQMLDGGSPPCPSSIKTASHKVEFGHDDSKEVSCEAAKRRKIDVKNTEYDIQEATCLIDKLADRNNTGNFMVDNIVNIGRSDAKIAGSYNCSGIGRYDTGNSISHVDNDVDKNDTHNSTSFSINNTDIHDTHNSTSLSIKNTDRHDTHNSTSFSIEDTDRHDTHNSTSLSIKNTDRHDTHNSTSLSIKNTDRHDTHISTSLNMEDTDRHDTHNSTSLSIEDTDRHDTHNSTSLSIKNTDRHDTHNSTSLSIKNTDRHDTQRTVGRNVDKNDRLNSNPDRGNDQTKSIKVTENDYLGSSTTQKEIETLRQSTKHSRNERASAKRYQTKIDEPLTEVRRTKQRNESFNVWRLIRKNIRLISLKAKKELQRILSSIRLVSNPDYSYCATRADTFNGNYDVVQMKPEDLRCYASSQEVGDLCHKRMHVKTLGESLNHKGTEMDDNLNYRGIEMDDNLNYRGTEMDNNLNYRGIEMDDNLNYRGIEMDDNLNYRGTEMDNNLNYKGIEMDDNLNYRGIEMDDNLNYRGIELGDNLNYSGTQRIQSGMSRSQHRDLELGEEFRWNISQNRRGYRDKDNRHDDDDYTRQSKGKFSFRESDLQNIGEDDYGSINEDNAFGYQFRTYLSGSAVTNAFLTLWQLVLLVMSTAFIVIGVLVEYYFSQTIIRQVKNLPKYAIYAKFLHPMDEANDRLDVLSDYADAFGALILVCHACYLSSHILYVTYGIHKIQITLPISALLTGAVAFVEICTINVVLDRDLLSSADRIEELKCKLLNYEVGSNNSFDISYDYTAVLLHCCGIVEYYDFLTRVEFFYMKTADDGTINKVPIQLPPTCCKQERFAITRNVHDCAEQGEHHYSEGCLERLLDVLSLGCNIYSIIVWIHLIDIFFHASIYKRKVTTLSQVLDVNSERHEGFMEFLFKRKLNKEMYQMNQLFGPMKRKRDDFKSWKKKKKKDKRKKTHKRHRDDGSA